MTVNFLCLNPIFATDVRRTAFVPPASAIPLFDVILKINSSSAVTILVRCSAARSPRTRPSSNSWLMADSKAIFGNYKRVKYSFIYLFLRASCCRLTSFWKAKKKKHPISECRRIRATSNKNYWIQFGSDKEKRIIRRWPWPNFYYFFY